MPATPYRKVFLFGAGASFGAAPRGVIRPENPPLGDGLFAELKRWFPRSWGALPTDLRHQFGQAGGFEPTMKRLHELHAEAVPELMQHMALYFVQFRPASGLRTLYGELIELMGRAGKQAEILLATLNYECLIEIEATRQSLAVHYGTSAPPPNAVNVWKLHGSCNFLPEGIQATRGVRYSSGITFNTGIRPVELNDAVAFCLGDTALPPVMCLFMEGKPTSVSPGSIAALWEAWRAAALAAESVILVGVQPHAVDAHIWEPLTATPARLFCVAGRSGVGAFEHWVAVSGRRGESRALPAYFGEAFATIAAEITD